MNRALAGRDGIGHFIGAKIYFNSEMVTDAINAFNGFHPTSVAGPGSTGTPALGLPAKPLAPLTAAAQSTTGPLGQTVKKVQSVVGTAQATGGDAVRLYNYLMGP
jgi:hypothetical protein